jgi:hypothetical protein
MTTPDNLPSFVDNLAESAETLRPQISCCYVHKDHTRPDGTKTTEDYAHYEMIGDHSPLLVICDGVGEYGEKSATVARWLAHVFTSGVKEICVTKPDTLTLVSKIKTLLTELNEAVHNQPQSEKGASTLLAGFLYNPNSDPTNAYWIIIGIGNGYIYKFREDNQFNAMDLSPKQDFPTYTVAMPYTVQPEIVLSPYVPGDKLFIATDGLGTGRQTFLKMGYPLDGYYLANSLAGRSLQDMYMNIVDHKGDPVSMHWHDDVTVGEIST